MANLSSIKSTFFYNLEVHDYRILIRHSFNIKESDYDILNKYVIYKANEYQAINIKDYCL